MELAGLEPATSWVRRGRTDLTRGSSCLFKRSSLGLVAPGSLSLVAPLVGRLVLGQNDQRHKLELVGLRIDRYSLLVLRRRRLHGFRVACGKTSAR
jgi:hypothetical protein